MAGRHSDYTEELGDSICEMIAEGMSLRDICKEEDMPNRATVYRWLASIPAFRDQYAHAREDQADTLADEIVAIADDGSRDYAKDEDGEFFVNHDHIQRAKLRVDARKWVAAKLKPKKYGERQTIEHAGNVGRTLEELSEEELVAMLSQIEAAKTKPE